MGLVDAVEARLSTDFALLYVDQAHPDLLSGPFASSEPGAVALMCGWRYATVAVRVELWDRPPPAASDDWEDRDLLPWSSAGPGPLRIHGFDQHGEDTLALGGLTRGRVEALAWGRHRYDYGTYLPQEALPPERWLLRLWPDPDGLEALSAPPRRLAGRQWLPPRRSAWDAALHAWVETAWSPALSGLVAFTDIEQALRLARRPRTQDGLLPADGRWDWQTPLIAAHASEEHRRHTHLQLAPFVAAASGTDRETAIDTYGDLLDLLRRLGLIAATIDGELLPNPCPPSAIDALHLFSGPGFSYLTHALEDYRPLAADLLQLQRWSPDQVLRASLTQLATRLAVTGEDILGAIRWLATLGHRIEPHPAIDNPDARLALHPPLQTSS